MKVKNSMAAGAFALAAFGASAAQGAVLAQWTFETNTPADAADSASGPPVLAEGGIGGGTLQGVHTSSASDWSTPAGNGSANSYSVNTWAVGDYFQFSTNSTGYEDVQISWDQTSSGTGPRDFKVQYGTDGSTFTDFGGTGGTYVVLANASPNPVWNSTTSSTIYTYTVDLSSITALNNDSSIFFRLVDTSTVSAGGGTVAAGGTGRIDNVSISATLIPEPAGIALLGSGAFSLLARRRRR